MTFGLDDAAGLMTAEEVAQLFRVKPASIYQAASDGRLPCVRLWKGRRRDLVRFRRSDVEKLIRERSSDTAQELGAK